MTQIGVVTALPEPGGDGKVGLTIARQAACGHACDGCGRCGGKAPALTIRASAGIPLGIGDRVEVYSDGKVLGIAALVYAAPVILFLLGYLLPVGLPEGWRYLLGGIGFVLGLIEAVVCDRLIRKGQVVQYQITRKL